MELALIKHGEPDSGALVRDDAGLSSAGQVQARQVAQRVAGGQWDVLLSSPRRFAIETAEIVAELTGLSVKVDDRLAGCGWDVRVDATGSSVASRVGAHGGVITENRHENKADVADVWHWVDKSLSDLTVTYQGQNIVAITHGTFIRATVSRILRTDEIFPHRPCFGSLTCLKLENNGAWGLGSLSETSHLRTQI